MRAFICTKYGNAGQLQLHKVAKPSPKPDEILIRVKAVSINSWDWDILSGKPIIRMIGPFKPPYKTLGADLSGVVEAVGENVDQFEIGDEVFGDVSDSGWGGFAEFVTGKAEDFCYKPEALSFEDAACLPQAGLLGYQGVRTFGQVKPGDKVLINGAGGGAGMFACQIAKLDGAEVTGIDSADKHEAMRTFGADYTHDYRQVDYTKLDQQFDVIIDAVANRFPPTYRRALTPSGTFVMMGGKIPAIIGILLASRKNTDEGQKFKILMWNVNDTDLLDLAQLVINKKISVHKENILPFEQTPSALQHVGDQKALGKLLIRVS
ncbi:NAD(P)-dependent alcohol dehydrogenase [uncultured Maritalea sp.]|uniref:NAD(P)-dependent alcohol dehydrogenase n=1 Tax=uncultured Maritalea sp. TaxID=757249 RepID=UPI00262AFA90|nr:NAD(P)-dependent alcohol dehydrogenase [uncultured Maritalea sp.]